MTSALLFIDVQRNMLEGDMPVPSAAEVRAALASLLDRARAAGSTVVHVYNDGDPGDPDQPGTDGWEPVFEAADGELVVHKRQSNAFADNPGLADHLRDRDVSRVVLCGFHSNYCVQASGRAALAQGFSVDLASGAHATYDEEEPAADIAAAVESELIDYGVSVLAADDVRFG